MAGSNGYPTEQVVTDHRSVGELFQSLAADTRNLVNLELALAKTELTEKASQTGKDIGFIAAGGLVAYAGVLAIIAAVIVGLANLIPAWLSALIVGGVVALVGYLLVRKGLNDLKQHTPVPRQTIDTLKEDKEWVQEQVSHTRSGSGGA